ncbi:SRPBCC domain-containing protein [Hyphococcus sp.]|uniref:SRPBCC domain-containing protein n=1 Tax=Hyphococcus sp. TaxID=2038636 RepID=UPI0035C6D907
MNEDKKYVDKQVYRVVINAPIETVWSELVNTASPRPFFWNARWDTKAGMTAGAKYRMASNDDKVVAVIGDIIEMDPPNKLVTSFQLTSLPDPASTVTYLLQEVDGGTEFSLVTEHIVAGSKSEKSMAAGSKFIVENFKAYVETGKVTFGARMMNALYGLMTPMTPKALRAENWPLD